MHLRFNTGGILNVAPLAYMAAVSNIHFYILRFLVRYVVSHETTLPGVLVPRKAVQSRLLSVSKLKNTTFQERKGENVFREDGFLGAMMENSLIDNSNET